MRSILPASLRVNELRQNRGVLTMQFASLAQWWASVSTAELMWLGLGFAAQMMFAMRFIIQWIASERVRRSIVPEAFWYFSFVGGLMLFIYAVRRMDPVFIMGQGLGLLIYSRNIYFIWHNKRLASESGAAAYRAPAE